MASNSSIWYPTIGHKLRVLSKRKGKCLLWQGPITFYGYGDISYDTQRLKTHRVALEIKLGRPLRPGMWSCHARECPNKHCIEPDHLYEGTPQSNRADDMATGKVHRGEQIVQSVLKARQVRRIRKDPRLLREIAADYGISEGHVSEIKHRKKWAHLA